MIRLLLAPYNDTELDKLTTLLGKMETLLQNEQCDRHDCCSECEYRHLCSDLQEAKKFTEEVRQ